VVSGQLEIPPDVFERVSAICLALPEVSVRVDFSRVERRSTAHAFDIRRRPFCLLVAVADSNGEPISLVVLRAGSAERAALLATGHPYFPTRGGSDRLGLLLTNEPDWDEVRELVTESYRLLAPKKLSALLD
jgi:YjbR